MGRILAIDFGTKRSGIAVTDPEQIIANGLVTIASGQLLVFLQSYMEDEVVDTIVLGYPMHNDDRKSGLDRQLKIVEKKIGQQFPKVRLERYDERFTSRMALKTMIDAGIKKSCRRDKTLVDKISATIILQSYMESIQNKDTAL